jgi:transposase
MMKLTEDQYELIRPLMPVQRGNVRIANLDVINAVLCRRAWLQMAWAAGALRQLAHHLHASAAVGGSGRAGSIVPGVTRTSPDPRPRRMRRSGQHQRQGSPRRHGRAKKNGAQAIGRSRGGWNTKIHLVAADDRTALTFALSPGQAGDAPEGRKLLAGWKRRPASVPMAMDRAYEGDATRQLVLELGFEPVVPPHPKRVQPWTYDRNLYRRRNQIERLFRRHTGFRRLFTRFEKLDLIYTAYIHYALNIDMLCVHTP